MAAEVKQYESARRDMYAAIEASDPQRALQLYQEASSKFALFLQDASKSYGVYIDLVIIKDLWCIHRPNQKLCYCIIRS
jgi:hypothetical protein